MSVIIRKYKAEDREACQRICIETAAPSRPAHMHIDILPTHQRMGIGTQLVNTLLSQLKSDGVPSLFLITDIGNTKGPAFYNKYGFCLRYKILSALVDTMELS